MKIIKLKSKNKYTRGIILEPLLPLHYIFNNTNELKIYHFSIIPSLQITSDENNKSIEIKIIWIMGSITFIKTLDPLYSDILFD